MRFVYQVWQAYKNGAYPKITSEADLETIGASKPIRIGAWGDPASVPTSFFYTLLSHCPETTGYTSQWKKFPELKPFVMASVSSKRMASKAWEQGWRTYRITPIDDLEPNERWCNYQENNLIQCLNCPNPCDGGRPSKWSIAVLPGGRRKAALSDKIMNLSDKQPTKTQRQTLLVQ